MLVDISNGIQSILNFCKFLFQELQVGLSDFGQFGQWFTDLLSELPTFIVPFFASALAIMCFNKFFRLK